MQSEQSPKIEQKERAGNNVPAVMRILPYPV